MKVFLIVVAVIVVIFALIFSLSATFTIIYDKKWSTKIKVLWIEKDIELTKILSFILFPDKAAEDYKNKKEDESEESEAKDGEEGKKDETKPENAAESTPSITITDSETGEVVLEIKDEKEENRKEQEQEEIAEGDAEKESKKEKKPNFIKKIWDEDGIVGIMEMVSNLLSTASAAINSLFKGLHIYSLYVKIIVGGGDAAEIATKYGKVCQYYYPIKGIVLNGMKVDNCDDLIEPDFIAPSSEYGFQLIGSLSVGAIVKMVLKAGKVFLVNIIKK